MQDQTSGLEWQTGNVPVSTRFDDPYFSLDNGLDETNHVFLAGNDLPARFCDRFHVAELGFGTGLNLLATVAAWRAADVPGILHFTTFEAFPLHADDMIRAQEAFPGLQDIARELSPFWRAGHTTFSAPGLTFTLILGDARHHVPAWQGRADAWFLDGFSPAKNPEMWGHDLMQEIGTHTAAGGTVATYTAAGFVRRGLVAAGFEIERTPGFGRKRHMTRGRLEARTDQK